MNTQEFIEKAKKIHGDKYDYSKVEYVNSHTKVCIICPEHGEFWQAPRHHLKGSGCPNCAGKIRLTTEEFIRRAKEVHGNRYDYSKVKYVNTRRKVCIICPKHGEFWQIPLHHLKGSGCPNCAGKIRLTTEEFIRKAKEVHGDRYDYSKVEYINALKKVCIICPKHGEFWQTASEHLRGQGCPKCAYEKQISSSTITTEEFIRKAKEVHGDRYDYSKVEYVNTRTKVRIICPEHGEFLQIPNNHLQGQGCPYCAGKIRLTTEEFIRKAKEVHGDRYDYSKVEYMNGPTKVCIICPKHGEFWQISRDHLQGQGCPKCAQEKHKSNTEEFIRKAKEVHGDRYDYSKVEYINALKKVCIICPKHGEFWQIPASHLSGKGCPNCNESQMEKNTANFLEENNIEYIRQARKTDLVWLGRQSLDFYLPKYNIAIECQGIQHFESVAFFGGKREYSDGLKRDLSKYNKCLSNNVKLIYYVPESLVEEITNNTKYNNIYNSENVFSDLTEFNEKYLVI